MNAPSAKKNMFRRHPILTGFAGLSLAFIIFAMLTQNTEYKKLDYSKAIVTDDHAIVCPQSLLFDLRADHDANAILDAFTALSSRDEKARALGCEVLQGGISVTAHRMSLPSIPMSPLVSQAQVQTSFSQWRASSRTIPWHRLRMRLPQERLELHHRQLPTRTTLLD